MSTEEKKECAGLFSPCEEPVTHELPDPRGKGKPVYLCDKHWEFSQQLEKALEANPKFAKNFAAAIEEQERKIN